MRRYDQKKLFDAAKAIHWNFDGINIGTNKVAFATVNEEMRKGDWPTAQAFGQAVESFVKQAHRLYIDTDHKFNVPLVEVMVNYDDIKGRGAESESLFVVTVVKGDKKCRFALNLIAPDSTPGQVYGHFMVPKRGDTVIKNVKGDFWIDHKPGEP